MWQGTQPVFLRPCSFSSVRKTASQPASQPPWRDRSSAWGAEKVFSAHSGQLRSRRFPSTPLLLTQQKGTEFSSLFRVSFANLQKQGGIFLCSPASCWGSSCQHTLSVPTAQPGVTQSSPSRDLCCYSTEARHVLAFARRQPRGLL